MERNLFGGDGNTADQGTTPKQHQDYLEGSLKKQLVRSRRKNVGKSQRYAVPMRAVQIQFAPSTRMIPTKSRQIPESSRSSPEQAGGGRGLQRLYIYYLFSDRDRGLWAILKSRQPLIDALLHGSVEQNLTETGQKSLQYNPRKIIRERERF